MSEVFEKVVAELNLDRSDWQLVKFGDIAIQQKQTVDRENTGLTRYVKGEHMRSEDLRLREWGELKDEYLGPAFIRKFEAGDILYGSRRTYLRKVVIAPFDGITSNTTFVIKANEARIDKRLLPYIMLSERFAQHSIRNAKGSVNPYVNWKDLSDYEFLLPGMKMQSQLISLLDSSEEALESKIALQGYLTKYLRSKEFELYGSKEQKNNTKLKKLLVKTLSGGTPDTKNSSFYDNGEIPWITTRLLNDTFVDSGESTITQLAIESSAAKVLPMGNILAGTRVGVGKFSINNVDISFSQDITGLLFDHALVDVYFLIHQLNSFIFKHKVLAFSRGTTIKGITKDDLLELEVYVPDTKTQTEIKIKFSHIKKSIKDVGREILILARLHKSIINQVF